MITDPARVKLSDPGHPDVCNVYSYYKIFSDGAKAKEVYDWCTGAKKGCTDCKKELAGIMDSGRLREIRERRAELQKDKAAIDALLREGQKKASAIARKTMD